MKTRRMLTGLGLLGALLLAEPAHAAISFQFDYRYDTAGFFAAGSGARACLEAAAGFYNTILDDTLTAIESDSENHFNVGFNRPDTDEPVTLYDFSVPADTLVVFVGSQALGGNYLGWGGPGGYEASGYLDWLENVQTRGEGSVDDVEGPMAIDVAPWGGTVAVDNQTNWCFDPTRVPSGGQSDLFSTLLHELVHVLGVGTSYSWLNRVNGYGQFTGAAAMAEYGGVVPLQSSKEHWTYGTMSRIYADGLSQEVAMDPDLTIGTRKLATDLDVAGLDDTGWEIHPRSVWNAAAGGAFGTAGHWSTSAVPGTRDVTQFRLAGVYTVSFSANVTNDRALVDQGDVTFDLNASRYTLDYLTVTGSGASLTAADGSLRINRQAWVSAGGALAIGAGGRLELPSTLSGAIDVESDGTVTGSGVVAGLLENAGRVEPGESIGSLTVTSYTQTADGTLAIEIGGATPGTQFDRLLVSNQATLDGLLEVTLAGGFTPTLSDTFEVMTYGWRSGMFDAVNCSGGWTLLPTYGAHALTLRVAAPGDATGDGIVNAADAAALAAHWLWTSGVGWSDGDFNGDGRVNDLDASILAAHWNYGTSGAAVPEPGTLLLLLSGLTTLGLVRRRGSIRGRVLARI